MKNRQLFLRMVPHVLIVFLVAWISGCSASVSLTTPSPTPWETTAGTRTKTYTPTIPEASASLPMPSSISTNATTRTATRTRIPTTTPILPDPFAPPLPAFALGRLGKGSVAAMQLSPNERYLAVASRIGVYLYKTDVDTGVMKEVWFQATTRAAVSVAFSPDGRIVAAGLQGQESTEYFCAPHLGGGGILVLDTVSGDVIRFLDMPSKVTPTDLSFTADGSSLLYIEYSIVNDSGYIWKLDDPEPHGIADSQGEGWERVWDLAASPDGKWLALAVQNRDDLAKTEVLALETGTNRIVYRWEIPTLSWAMSFSPDSSRLAVGDAEKNLRVWGMSTGEEIASTIIPDMRQLRFAPDNRRIFVRTADGIRLWDASENQTVWSLAASSRGISLSYDGLHLFSYDAETLTIRNAMDGTKADDYLVGHESVSTPAYSADGKELLARTNWGTIKVWDAPTRRVLRSIRLSGKWSGFELAADNRTMAVNRGKSIEIWDYQQGNPVRTVAMPETGASEIAISPDGGKLAAFSGEKVYLLVSLSGKILMQQASVGGVAFSPDGKLLAFSSADGAQIILWDIPQGAVSTTLDYGWKYGASNLDFSPDSRHLGMAGYGPGVRWWEISDPHTRTIAELDLGYPTQDIAFSPDGITGAAASYDILLWELSSGRRLRVMTGHACYPTEVVYSPDGTVLASGSADGTVLLWDVAAALKPE